jgi:hypothetical protein
MGLSNEDRAKLTPATAPRAVGELLDGFIVPASCDAGHQVTYAIQDPPFDLLFELAALALVDGYYREAIAGAHTALERFFEFYVHVALHERGVGGDHYESYWKVVQNHSERQLGAFLATYLAEEGRPYDSHSFEEHAKLRNRVAHKGYLATRDESAEYLKWVLGTIHGILPERYPLAASVDPMAAAGTTRDWLKALYLSGNMAHARVPSGQRVSVLAKTSLVNFAAPGTWGKVDIEAHLPLLAGARSIFKRGQ